MGQWWERSDPAFPALVTLPWVPERV